MELRLWSPDANLLKFTLLPPCVPVGDVRSRLGVGNKVGYLCFFLKDEFDLLVVETNLGQLVGIEHVPCTPVNLDRWVHDMETWLIVGHLVWL